jgi:ankyrin repeat protein
MAAAYRGHIHLVAFILANGAHADAQDQQNRSALWLAVEQGHVQVIKELLKSVYDTNVNIRDEHGQSLLHVAIQKNHVKVIEVLLQHDHLIMDEYNGATIDLPSTVLHPLLLSIEHNLHSILPTLYYYCEAIWLSRVADFIRSLTKKLVSLSYWIQQLNAQIPVDDQDRNPFILACAHGHLTACQALLHCMCATIKLPIDEQQQLACPLRLDRETRQRRLLNQTNTNRRTALWWASANGHVSVVRRLCHSPFTVLLDKDCRDNEGTSAWDVAAQYKKAVIPANDQRPDKRINETEQAVDSRVQQLFYDIRSAIISTNVKQQVRKHKK